MRSDPASLKAFLSPPPPPELKGSTRKPKAKGKSPYPAPSLFTNTAPSLLSSSPSSTTLASPISPMLAHGYPLPLAHAYPFFTTREFGYPSSDTESEPSSPSTTTSAPGFPPNFADMGLAKPSIRVFLLRQICARVHGQRAWRNVVLGEGKLSLAETQLGSEAEGTMDWEGEVRCKDDVTVGGFNAGTLIVKVSNVAAVCFKGVVS